MNANDGQLCRFSLLHEKATKSPKGSTKFQHIPRMQYLNLAVHTFLVLQALLFFVLGGIQLGRPQ